MFKSCVIIYRPDTKNEFFYHSDGMFTDPVFIEMVTKAKEDKKLLNEELILTDGDKFLERYTTWESEKAFDDFLAAWLEYRPSYLDDLNNYCKEKEHFLSTQRVSSDLKTTP
jgi:hypothetical protein